MKFSFLPSFLWFFLPSFRKVIPKTTAKTAIDEELKNSFDNFATARNLAYNAGAIPDGEAYGYQDASGTWHFFIKEDLNNLDALAPMMQEEISVNGTSYKITDVQKNEYVYNPIESYLTADDEILDTKLEEALAEYAQSAGLVNQDGSYDTSKIFARYDENDANWHFFNADDFATGNVRDYSSNVVTYIGNSVAKELTSGLTSDQVAELAQILKDCPDSSMKEYLSFNNNGELV